MTTCPICHARGARPCTEGDVALGQYHAARVRLEAVGRIDAMGEAERLRREAQAAVIRDKAKQGRSGR